MSKSFQFFSIAFLIMGLTGCASSPQLELITPDERKPYESIQTISIEFEEVEKNATAVHKLNVPRRIKNAFAAAGLKIVQGDADASMKVIYGVEALGSGYTNTSGTQYVSARIVGMIKLSTDSGLTRNMKFQSENESPYALPRRMPNVADAPFQDTFELDCRQPAKTTPEGRTFVPPTLGCRLATLIGLMRGPDGVWSAYEKGADTGLRASLVLVLGRFGATQTKRLEQVLLSKADQHVRSNAAYSLGLIGDKKAVPSLITALARKEKTSVWAYYNYENDVTFALKQNPDPAAVDTLINRLGDLSYRSKQNVMEALQEITGVDHGDNAAAWRAWWAANKEQVIQRHNAP